MSEGEHSASEDSVAAIHQRPQHWKTEILMAEQSLFSNQRLKPLSMPWLRKEESSCMSFRTRTHAESWKTRRP
jgi:hypothetical protein